MLRLNTQERKNWQDLAKEYGFYFHTMHGEPYWDESAYYQFTLEQIENDLEAPSEELHQMCLHVVEQAINNEHTLGKLAIPQRYWQPIYDSWQTREPSLYSRLDFSYDGKTPAKLLENNADTPTSLYETGFWQWLWLEQKVDSAELSKAADQFNSLQEKLVHQFATIAEYYNSSDLHFACCKDSIEDRGTVQYLQDCALDAGVSNKFVFIEDIGLSDKEELTDDDNYIIQRCFKLYPWEFMQREEFGPYAISAGVKWIEPIWKSILSNKGLLPLLWKAFEGHPNLLPSYFADEVEGTNHRLISADTKWVKKPLYSREGANISILKGKNIVMHQSDGPYGEEGFIYQAFHALPKFGQNYTLIGSWLVDDKAAGISIREDKDMITQDMSRFLPHIIL